MSLFDQIIDFNNLYASYKRAAQGKHDRLEVLRHDLHAEKILWRLQRQLRDGSYRHGKYRTFKIYDPKERDVSAAPFTDRIVHHALVSQIEPLFERIFIDDSYACRRGKGTHRAVLRLQHFLRSVHDRFGQFYVLRADIRKFFATINHAILLRLLSQQIRDRRTLALCGQIIGSYREISQPLNGQLALEIGSPPPQANLESKPITQPSGQPIGNLTSQLFANVYLNELDQFVKHSLREKYYLRYMDDFLIIHPSKEHLQKVRVEIKNFLGTELSLSLHQQKTNLHQFTGRECFVGYAAGLYVRRLAKPTVQRFLRKLKWTYLKQGRGKAEVSWRQFQAYSSFAHARGLLKAINPFGTGGTDAV